ncbi:unnamed protein product [Chondrus crispus]|uniref:Chromo domain-containing protein n=1 Tax=Chondrus crispus TaxID=2769 RepID=R7Q518_CHOCR|nr:unnamed protein product [Chondrus crispus]CDF33642.1 unnamed protein product [Chondrus crispus]|eukprot:XP_005713461.1 unnamed protein product [Chondrus crispus]
MCVPQPGLLFISKYFPFFSPPFSGAYCTTVWAPPPVSSITPYSAENSLSPEVHVNTPTVSTAQSPHEAQVEESETSAASEREDITPSTTMQDVSATPQQRDEKDSGHSQTTDEQHDTDSSRTENAPGTAILGSPTDKESTQSILQDGNNVKGNIVSPGVEGTSHTPLPTSRLTRSRTRLAQQAQVALDPPASQPTPTGPKPSGEGKEHVLHKVIADGHTEDGELFLKVRWYGYNAEGDTWEPIQHLPRSHVLPYDNRLNLHPPDTIGNPQVG